MSHLTDSKISERLQARANYERPAETSHAMASCVTLTWRPPSFILNCRHTLVGMRRVCTSSRHVKWGNKTWGAAVHPKYSTGDRNKSIVRGLVSGCIVHSKRGREGRD